MSLGTFAPALLLSAVAYNALQRHKYLTGSSSLKGAKLVSSLKLINNEELEINSHNYILPNVRLIEYINLSYNLHKILDCKSSFEFS